MFQTSALSSEICEFGYIITLFEVNKDVMLEVITSYCLLNVYKTKGDERLIINRFALRSKYHFLL